MRFLATFAMGVKYLWRDPVSVVILTLFPIVIILVLGTALDATFSTDISFEPTTVAVVAEPNSPMRGFVQSDGISQFFDSEFTDLATAEEMVADGTASAAFIEEADGNVRVLLPSTPNLMSQIALTVIDSYQQIGTAGAIAFMSGRDIASLIEVDIQITDQPLGTRIPGAMDYYAVTMLVMILLFAGFNGLEMFHKGLFSDMGHRMRLCPINKPSLVGGLMAAATFASFMQGMVVFLFSAVVYGVYWGQRIPLVLLTLFAVVLFSQALCVLLFVIFGKVNSVMGIAQLLFFAMTFVSGGYMLVSFDGVLGRIFEYVPNALAHTVIFGAIYGGDEAQMTLYLGILFAMGAVLSALAFIVGRRRLA